MTNIELSPNKKSSLSGCGLFAALFGRRKKKFSPRRATPTGSIPTRINGNINIIFTTSRKTTAAGNTTTRRPASVVSAAGSNAGIPPRPPTSTSSPRQRPSPAAVSHIHNGRNFKPPPPPPPIDDQTGMLVPVSNHTVAAEDPCSGTMVPVSKTTVAGKEPCPGISGELDSLIAEHQRKSRRGNAVIHKNLGNLRQAGGTTYTYSKPAVIRDNNNNNNNTVVNGNYKPIYPTSVMGNIVNNHKKPPPDKKGVASLCRALSCRMDPEELRILGNEDFKNGRFSEALALYERAIDLEPSKAAHRTNKSAALAALGRLLEAVFECREAIRFEPRYQRAHHRLANLYLRLGEAENTAYHFRQAGPEADPDEMNKAKIVLTHLKKCDEAKRRKDWHTLLKESSNAVAAGADSSPLIFALQAEAYLKLHKYQEAEVSLSNSPNFSVDQCTKFFGPIANASILVIKAQVDMAVGRFDEALNEAEHASRLNPTNREAGIVARRARAVSAARSHGNDFFKDSNFAEACSAYSLGLEHDPYNSVLLCNRAACNMKLGKFERAIEDCTTALNVRPSYTKARLRRADCNAKLRKWELAIKDYEILLQESPGDEGVCKALFEALLQIKKQRGEDTSDMKFANGVVKIHSNEHFRNLTSWPGLLVAFFSNTTRDKQTLQFMDQLCTRYPTVKFIKVEAEDNKWLVKSEDVSSLPAFKIYKSGSRVKEVPGEDHEALESSIKDFIIGSSAHTDPKRTDCAGNN